MTEILRTERLVLRRFTPADLDLLLEMHRDEATMRHVGGVLTPQQSLAMLQTRMIQYYQDNPGLGIWLTEERATGTRVGMHLLNHIQGETLIQVGYVLHRNHWGRGYATEMARAILRYGFRELGLPRIHAICNHSNVDSQRVLLKCGLARNGERFFPHPAYAPSGPLAFFEREAADWLAWDAARPPANM
jgi:[ribosomal protein S5]-alanine N-acetyltransferase